MIDSDAADTMAVLWENSESLLPSALAPFEMRALMPAAAPHTAKGHKDPPPRAAAERPVDIRL